MKQLKTLALFTVLFVVSACSTSGNDTKNNGGNGGGSDAFLTAISKYSKMTGINGNSGELSIRDGGKTLLGINDMDGYTFLFVESISATVGKYTAKVTGEIDEDATITVNGVNVVIQSKSVGSEPDNTAEFELE